jgi:hypothetical protein
MPVFVPPAAVAKGKITAFNGKSNLDVRNISFLYILTVTVESTAASSSDTNRSALLDSICSFNKSGLRKVNDSQKKN